MLICKKFLTCLRCGGPVNVCVMSDDAVFRLCPRDHARTAVVFRGPSWATRDITPEARDYFLGYLLPAYRRWAAPEVPF